MAYAISPGATALSFDAAIALAVQNAPQARMAQAKLDAARAAARPAGELPDPKLALGLDDFPIGGPDRNSFTSDPMTMARISIMQEVPNRDKRNARVDAAQARITRSQAEQRLSQLTLRLETAKAWIRRYTIEQQLAQLGLLLLENQRFALAIQAQLASGRASVADIVLPRQEAAMLAERRDELDAQRSHATAALARWIGNAAEAPLQGEPRQWQIQKEALVEAKHRRPDLLALAATGNMIDAEVRETQAGKKPDWGVEFAYKRRAVQFGDMISIQFSFDLPVFPVNRQDPQIAAKVAERASLEAERDALVAEHTQMINNDLADLERVKLAVERNRRVLQPLAQEKIMLSQAAYQNGKGSLSDVMLARREALELALKQTMLVGEQAIISAQLHYTFAEHKEPHQ
jgi:outer membrane protein TolC